jgi:hypothetical protein
VNKRPRGLYYERARNRWRVRLFYQQKLIWRSYHYNERQALEALQHANLYRMKLAKSGKLKTLNRPPSHLRDLL